MLRAGALEVALRVGVVVREKLSFPVNYSVSACFVLFYFFFFFGNMKKIFPGYESEKRDGDEKGEK